MVALTVILATPRANGYEISIYAAYPPYFWLLLILSLASGVFILVRQAFAEDRSHLWVAGFAVILTTASVVLLLPLLRGYAFYGRGDPLHYLGNVKDIQSTGHFGAEKTVGENFYPASHDLVANISYVTGLDPKLLLMLLPTLFFAFYAVSIYLLSRVLTNSHRQSLMLTAFGSLPLFGWMQSAFFPSCLTFFLLPFLLFLYYRARQPSSRTVEFAALFVLVLLSMPFFHPANGGPFLAIVLLSLCVGEWICKRSQQGCVGTSSPDVPILRGLSLNPTTILIVVWFLWFSSTRMFELSVQEIYKVLTFSGSETQAFLERGPVSLSLLIRAWLLSYGPLILYSGLAVTVGFRACTGLFFRQGKAEPKQVGLFVMFAIFVVLFLLAALGALRFGSPRLWIYIIFSAALLSGLGLHDLLKGGLLKRLRVPIVTVLLVAAGVMGMLSVHPSPLTYGSNQQITAMDLDGARWFFDHDSEELLIDELAFIQRYYVAAVKGSRVWPRNVRDVVPEEARRPPEHFGYDRGQTYGEASDKDRYFISDKLSRAWYAEGLVRRYETFSLWTPEDFERLEEDSTVSRVYSNGEFETFYITAESREVLGVNDQFHFPAP